VSQGLTERAKEALREPMLAHIASLDAKSRSDMTPGRVDVDDDDVLFNFRARKHLGTVHPNRRDGEQRVKVRIRPERIAMQPQ
jgi:hypothetical protein